MWAGVAVNPQIHRNVSKVQCSTYGLLYSSISAGHGELH